MPAIPATKEQFKESCLEIMRSVAQDKAQNGQFFKINTTEDASEFDDHPLSRLEQYQQDMIEDLAVQLAAANGFTFTP